jgi:hypothetical protein
MIKDFYFFKVDKKLGKGQNYEFHNVKNQKEHRKSWRQSLHQKWLLSCF